MAKTYLESLLAQKESVRRVARQHWFLLLRAILFEVFLLAVIVFGVSALTALFFPIAAVGYLLVLVPLVMLLRDALDWWNRQYVLTNRRVIQVRGTLNKSVMDSSLEKVNDVRMTQSFLGRLFNFADLEILTASEAGIDRLAWLEDPIAFKTAMLDAKEEMGGD